MTISPSKVERAGLKRSASRNISYVDLTKDSDAEDDVVPLETNKIANASSKRKREATPETSGSELDDEEFEVERILDARIRAIKGGVRQLEYRVRWVGYGKDEDSWTHACQFHDDDDLVVAFYKQNPRKPRHPVETPKGNQLKASRGTRDLKSMSAAQENVKPGARRKSTVTVEIVSPKATETGKTAPATKPKRKQSEESDDEYMGSDGAGTEDDLESASDEAESSASEASEPEEVEEKPKTTAKKTHGSWGSGGAKAVKKKAVKLDSFKTGVTPLKGVGDITKAARGMCEDLPPINDIEAMFDHLTSRLPSITKLVQQLNGRKLRVATMCSGTESPLLALNMIAKAIKVQHGLTLAFDHVFSCEIEPFKQAYIERNFSPPILFRDVTELGRKRAHTAYGSMVEVPGNVDILIAGTSCVDYSGLNNERQDIDANGESGRTFRGMLRWVNKHRPPVVILENVCSAPWDKVVTYFDEIDYDAQYQRLDTKEFYIPHTRTRVYLFATPKEGGQHLPEKWAQTVKELRRPWSSPFEAFLLPVDNANIHRARLDLAAARYHQDGTARKATDWSRCESRHFKARHDEELGIHRPLTAWKEAGVCKGLDWTWNDWLLSQTERVLDLLEISTLRMAKDAVDVGFKACIWNVSQNVDRQTGASRTALAQCLTPNMIPWVTNRGGPVTGREALALQGIPVRELLLTSENEDQLADLAGNAMTTTVVGASMLAALALATDKIVKGDEVMADVDREREREEQADDAVAQRIMGEDKLATQTLDLAKVVGADLKEILDLAERSSRHCQCEGQTGTAMAAIDECSACGYRSCQACGGRPEHVSEACTNERVEPTVFEQRFKELLPMRVLIAGLDTTALEAVRATAKETGKGSVDDKDWALWSEAVVSGTQDAEFRFRSLKRQTSWTAVYSAPHATLELLFQQPTPEWRLTIKAPEYEPVNSRLRTLLLHPAARLRFDMSGEDVLRGPWELCVPSRQSFDVSIASSGEAVPTWQASLGLQGTFEGELRWSQLDVTVPPEADRALDRKLSGKYTLLPKCGQAMNSLHRKDADDTGVPLYLFLDPSRIGDAADDTYVFATTHDRLDYGTERAVVASLSPKWRESSKSKEVVRLDVHGGWVVSDSARLTAIGGDDIAVDSGSSQNVRRDTATYAMPGSDLVQIDTTDCAHSMALLSVKVPLDPSHSEAMWRAGAWGEIDLLHQGNATFANLAWITERLPPLDVFRSWQQIDTVALSGMACNQCAPLPPTIHWFKQAGKPNKKGNKTKANIIAYEDKLEAGRYEAALKNRPAPFTVQLRLDDTVGSVRIGLNIVSLAHRALARLPSTNNGEVRLSWRLTPGQVTDLPMPPREFVLPSNKQDPEHQQPRSFKLSLRKEQLRSLHWMLAQERVECKTHTFVEEEISEAVLPALGWRAEGKAERPVMVRGGVIADQVGYGKTIISLALVAETKGESAPELAPQGFIDLKATLIVVPGHLSRQWPSEIERFTGKLFRLIVIQNMGDLKKHSIAELAKADIIVVAADVLEADAYWERFEYFSAQPAEWLSDKQGGRFFADRLDAAVSTLREQVAHMVANDEDAAVDNMKRLHEQAHAVNKSKKDELKATNFGKRLKGAAYRDRYDATEPARKKAKTSKNSKGMWDQSDDEEEEEEVSAPRPTFRSAQGTESLGSSTVKRDYTLLANPVLHMFRFRRIIADEFTYLEKKQLAGVLRLSSSYKWVLSGTPPVSDFAAIRSIATFLGLRLGVEDDAEGTAAAQKARAKEQTAAEKFHAFREVHSAAWHRRRDDLAQEFLNTFVRQNIAEIDDIPTVEHIHNVKLPASEGAVYLELEHHLQALEMQARKEKQFKNVTQGDRNARLEEALSDSKTAEEALLKRCCHFTLDLNDPKRDAKTAQEACEHIAGARQSQLAGCEDDLRRSIAVAVSLHNDVKRHGGFGQDRQPFQEWVQISFNEKKHQGDAEAAQRLIGVLHNSGFTSDGAVPSSTSQDAKETPKGKKAKVNVEEVKWALREQTHVLRRLSKELVARVRSLRFFDVVRKLQRNGAEATAVLEGSACAHKPSADPDADTEMAVLSCCGHVACLACMTEAADAQRCVARDACHAAVRHTNIVKVCTLGIEGDLDSGRFGAKLLHLVNLVKSIPSSDRVLVFVQWDDLFAKVSDALTAGKITHVTLGGAVKARSKTLDDFQTGASDARVLLLRSQDSSAAGSNLTTANHAVFLGPLLVDSLHKYRQAETQAIGRVRRYGQSKTVHIHRLLALDTIDVAIYNERTKEMKAKADYVEIPQEAWVPTSRKSTPRISEAEVENAIEIDADVD
ncbi:DNA (cytosine-5-)-methyltransferase dmt5 [Cryptotrichosporon argae]